MPVQWFCPFISFFISSCAENAEPGWVEVMVEILLSLLAQPSLLIRRISKSMFARICPNLTKKGLQLILDVSKAPEGIVLFSCLVPSGCIGVSLCRH